MGSVSSTFGFLARLEGTVRTDSGGESGLCPRADALRFRRLEGACKVPETELEVAAAAAAAAAVKVSAASLAAERVTLEDMRTSSVLSGR